MTLSTLPPNVNPIYLFGTLVTLGLPLLSRQSAEELGDSKITEGLVRPDGVAGTP